MKSIVFTLPDKVRYEMGSLYNQTKIRGNARSLPNDIFEVWHHSMWLILTTCLESYLLHGNTNCMEYWDTGEIWEFISNEMESDTELCEAFWIDLQAQAHNDAFTDDRLRLIYKEVMRTFTDDDYDYIAILSLELTALVFDMIPHPVDMMPLISTIDAELSSSVMLVMAGAWCELSLDGHTFIATLDKEDYLQQYEENVLNIA